MKREDLLKRIENVDFLTISKMSPEVLLRLTDNFKEQMVLKLVARGNTNTSQRIILSSVLKAYEENQKKTNPLWGMWGSEKYPEYLENLQLDIECRRLIIDEEEEQKKNDKMMDGYMANHTMTKEDIDKAISDTESITVTDEKSPEKIAALEERIKELKAEIKKLKSENKELKEQQTSTDDHDEIDGLKEEIEYLKTETGKLTSKEAAILTITACYHAGGLPPNRENLYPILTNLFGVGESLAKRRLREGINEKDVESLAKCFDEVSPVIARTLREMPEKLKNKKKEVKSHVTWV